MVRVLVIVQVHVRALLLEYLIRALYLHLHVLICIYLTYMYVQVTT